MQLELQKESSNVSISFDTGETDVLRAMYREKIARRVRGGEAATLTTPFESALAALPEDKTVKIGTNDTDNMIEDLKNFGHYTDGAVAGILEGGNVPDYANSSFSFIAERLELGRRALSMAQELHIENVCLRLLVEIEAGCFDPDLGKTS